MAVKVGMVAGLRATLLRNAWLDSGHIFYVMVNPVEVDSRPSLRRRGMEKCAQAMLQLQLVTVNSDPEVDFVLLSSVVEWRSVHRR